LFSWLPGEKANTTLPIFEGRMILTGDLSHLSPASLLQMLCQECRSVRIHAYRGMSRARIDLLEGLIGKAVCDDDTDAEAVYNWLAWDSGRFVVELLTPADRDAEIIGEWEELLLEAARRRDELEFALAPLPEPPTSQHLEALLASCPAIGGMAFVGYDGRLNAHVGINEFSTTQIATLTIALSQASITCDNEARVAAFAHGTQTLLFADWGHGTFVLAVVMAGASASDAARQLTAVQPAATEFLFAHRYEGSSA
jgi:Domain of unknown function (DUF4388)